MLKYGRIVNRELVTSKTMLQGFKRVEYAKIPSDFDQTIQYLVQLSPVDKSDHIFVGIEIHELEITEDEGFDQGIL